MSNSAHVKSPSKLVMNETKKFVKAVREAVEQHHKAGRPVPEERDGKIVWIGPDGKTVPAPRF